MPSDSRFMIGRLATLPCLLRKILGARAQLAVVGNQAETELIRLTPPCEPADGEVALGVVEKNDLIAVHGI